MGPSKEHFLTLVNKNAIKRKNPILSNKHFYKPKNPICKIYPKCQVHLGTWILNYFRYTNEVCYHLSSPFGYN